MSKDAKKLPRRQYTVHSENIQRTKEITLSKRVHRKKIKLTAKFGNGKKEEFEISEKALWQFKISVISNMLLDLKYGVDCDGEITISREHTENNGNGASKCLP
jgi:hypothetical protein